MADMEGSNQLDGKFLYYAKGATVPGIWRIPTTGGEETEVIGSLEPGYWGYWAIVESGIYYLDTTGETWNCLLRLHYPSHDEGLRLGEPPCSRSDGMGVSPDGRTILYTQLDALSRDIVLVENFR